MWPFGINNKYPYTDFHELNTDYLIEKTGKIDQNLQDSETAREGAETAQEAAETAQAAAETAQEGAETAEDNTEEYYNNLVTHIADDVTGWLAANVTPVGSTVAIDRSLTIEDAAADARAAGQIRSELLADNAAISQNHTLLDQYARFWNGANFGSFNDYNFRYRISTDDFTAPEDIFIKIDPDFKIAVHALISEGNYSDSGWITDDYFIPAGTVCSVMIARVTENTSEVADIGEFLSKAVCIDHSEFDCNLIDGTNFITKLVRRNYVRFSDGAYIASGEYFKTYEIENPKFKYIKVKSYSGDRVPAVIAFYTETDHSGYMSSDSIRFPASGFSTSDALVPDNCKLISVTVRDTTDGIAVYPEIYVDDSAYNYQLISDPEIININKLYVSAPRADGTRTDPANLSRLSTELYQIPNPDLSVSINSTDGYQFAILGYDGESTVFDSGWQTSYSGKIYCDSFYITVRHVVNGNEVYMGADTPDDIQLSLSVSSLRPLMNEYNIMDEDYKTMETSVELSGIHDSVSHLFKENKNIGHLFIDTIDQENPVIPCQSLWDLEVSNRLGFKVIELNCHKTQDGKYICLHGDGGNVGNQLKRIDGSASEIANLPFNQVTMEMLSDYVYKSKYTKYQTPVTTLEEALYYCQKNNITPMVQYAYDRNQISLIESIVGNNYILYVDGDFYLNRYYTNSMLFYYGAKTTVDEIINICKSMKPPFMYCISSSVLPSFTDDQLKQIVAGVHDTGCYVGFAGSYQSPVLNQKLLDTGFDFNSTGWDINPFNSGNIVELYGDMNYSDFYNEGTVTNGVNRLTANQYFSSDISETPFLAKAELTLKFSGTIKITFGLHIDHTFTSDGSKELNLSTYFIDGDTPNFSVQAVTTTTITEAIYKVAKV